MLYEFSLAIYSQRCPTVLNLSKTRDRARSFTANVLVKTFANQTKTIPKKVDTRGTNHQ